MTAVLAIIGRFCVNITFNIGLQYGAELIPTSVRAQGIVSFVHHHFLSMSSMTKLTMIKVSLYISRQAYVHIAGYVAAIVSPYIVDLVNLKKNSQFFPVLVES